MNAQTVIAKFEPSLDQLSPRERDVIALAAAHNASKEIAAQLDITVSTVNNYIAAARAKWFARDRNELVRIYLELLAAERTGRDAEADPIKYRGQSERGDEPATPDADDLSDLPTTATFRLSDVFAIDHGGNAEVPPPAGLEVLDSWFGRGWRFAAIPLLGLLIAATALVVITIATSLSGGAAPGT